MKWTGALILVSVVNCVFGQNHIQQQAIEGFNNFTLELLRQISPDDNTNFFFSGLSLTLAMGMLEVGAQNQTLQQIKTALGHPNLTKGQVLNVYRNIMNDAKLQTGNTTLTLANGAFVQNNFNVSKTYEQLLNKDFLAQVIMENFATNGQQAINSINTWVSTHTKGLIPKLYETPLPPETVLVLVNTVYFLGKWQIQFNKSLTVSAPFYVTNGQARVQMMSMSEKLQAGEDMALNLYIVVLHYNDNQTSMVLLVPKDRNAKLSSIEKKLNSRELNRLLSETSLRQVILRMPKFNLTGDYSLNSALQALGIRRAFTNNAQLGGISQQARLKVSEVKQKAVVQVNEEGTKAAAATGISVGITAVSPMVQPPLEINADHPFLFLILNRKTNLIMFTGRASDPNQFK